MEIDIAVVGGRHVLNTNTLLLCRGMRKGISFVVIRLASRKILRGPKRVFLPRNGNERP